MHQVFISAPICVSTDDPAEKEENFDGQDDNNRTWFQFEDAEKECDETNYLTYYDGLKESIDLICETITKEVRRF